jgi:hypothetical protein
LIDLGLSGIEGSIIGCDGDEAEAEESGVPDSPPVFRERDEEGTTKMRGATNRRKAMNKRRENKITVTKKKHIILCTHAVPCMVKNLKKK